MSELPAAWFLSCLLETTELFCVFIWGAESLLILLKISGDSRWKKNKGRGFEMYHDLFRHQNLLSDVDTVGI